jgi:hypothetical protein
LSQHGRLLGQPVGRRCRRAAEQFLDLRLEARLDRRRLGPGAAGSLRCQSLDLLKMSQEGCFQLLSFLGPRLAQTFQRFIERAQQKLVVGRRDLVAGFQDAAQAQQTVEPGCRGIRDSLKFPHDGENGIEGRAIQAEPGRPLTLRRRQGQRNVAAGQALGHGGACRRLEAIEARRQTAADVEPAAVDAANLPLPPGCSLPANGRVGIARHAENWQLRPPDLAQNLVQ